MLENKIVQEKTLREFNSNAMSKEDIANRLSIKNYNKGSGCDEVLTKSQILALLNIPTSCLNEEVLDSSMSKITFKKYKGSEFEILTIYNKDTNEKVLHYSTATYDTSGELIEQPYEKVNLVFNDTNATFANRQAINSLQSGEAFVDPLTTNITFSQNKIDSCSSDFDYVTIIGNFSGFEIVTANAIEGVIYWDLGNKLVSLNSAFYYQYYLTFVKNYTTHNSVEDISFMHGYNANLQHLELFRYDYVRYAQDTFKGCKSIPDIRVESMPDCLFLGGFLSDCTSLVSVWINNLRAVKDVSEILKGCISLVSFNLFDYYYEKESRVLTAADKIGTVDVPGQGTKDILYRGFGSEIPATQKRSMLEDCINLTKLGTPIDHRTEYSLYNVMETYGNCGIQKLPFLRLDASGDVSGIKALTQLKSINLSEMNNVTDKELGTYVFTDGISFSNTHMSASLFTYLINNAKGLTVQQTNSFNTAMGQTSPVINDLSDTTLGGAPDAITPNGYYQDISTADKRTFDGKPTPSFFKTLTNKYVEINLKSIIEEVIASNGATVRPFKKIDFMRYTTDADYRKKEIGYSSVYTIINMPYTLDVNAPVTGQYEGVLISTRNGNGFLYTEAGVYEFSGGAWSAYTTGGTGGSYDDTAVKASIKALEDMLKPANSNQMLVSAGTTGGQWANLADLIPPIYPNPTEDNQIRTYNKNGTVGYKPYDHAVNSADISNLKTIVDSIVNSNVKVNVAGLKFVDAGNGSYTLTIPKGALDLGQHIHIVTDMVSFDIPIIGSVGNTTFGTIDIVTNGKEVGTDIVLTFTPDQVVNMTALVIVSIFQIQQFNVTPVDTSTIEANILKNTNDITQLNTDVSGKNKEVGLDTVNVNGRLDIVSNNYLTTKNLSGVRKEPVQDADVADAGFVRTHVQLLQDAIDELVKNFSICKTDIGHVKFTKPSSISYMVDLSGKDLTMFKSGSLLLLKFSDTSNPNVIKTLVMNAFFDGLEHKENINLNGTTYAVTVSLNKDRLIVSGTFGTNGPLMLNLGLDYIICTDQVGLEPTDLAGYYKKIETYNKQEIDAKLLLQRTDIDANIVDITALKNGRIAWFDNTFRIGVTNTQKEFFPFARLYGTCANIKTGDAGEIMFAEAGYYSVRLSLDGLCGGSAGNLAHFKFNFWHGGNKFLSKETNNTVNNAGITYNLSYNFPLNVTDTNVGLKVEIENILPEGGFSVNVAEMFLEIEKLF